jgi:hypothetical protein
LEHGAPDGATGHIEQHSNVAIPDPVSRPQKENLTDDRRERGELGGGRRQGVGKLHWNLRVRYKDPGAHLGACRMGPRFRLQGIDRNVRKVGVSLSCQGDGGGACPVGNHHQDKLTHCRAPLHPGRVA